MSISSQEGHLPDQVNKSSLSRGNGNGNMMMMHIEEPTSHNDIISSSGPTTSRRSLEDQRPHKKEVIRYRECQKNHAAAIGGNATDGCGEFMPGGGEEEGTALKCSACNCHRNFHRKEVEGDEFSSECFRSRLLLLNNIAGRQLKSTGVVGPELVGYPTGTLISSATAPHQYHQMIMPYKMGFSHSQSDHEQEDRGGTRLPAGDGAAVKKRRFRTKFSQEQKEKMLSFAEKAGWKIQKLEESVVQHFCQEIGIKRRVLKVWMHNNKHNNLAKKTTSSTST